MLSKRITSIKPSATLRISSKAKELKKQGMSIIDLSVGEPDFNTPDEIKEKGKMAIDANFTKYTQSDGIPELKEAILRRLKLDDGLDYRPDQVIVSPGAKTSLFLVLSAILNPGDEVLIPSPYWVSYPEQVQLAGGIPVFIHTTAQNNFTMTINDLKSRISPVTKAVIINNPCNPTGAVYDPDHLRKLLEIAVLHNLYIIADEVYSKIVFNEVSFMRCASLNDAIFQKTITIDGVSKAYAMTGWRIGYAAGPLNITTGMKSFQDHLTSNPCSIAQKAAQQAFAGSQDSVKEYTSHFQERRDILFKQLIDIPGIQCTKPQGTFYMFPDISSYFNTSDGQTTIQNSNDLTEYILDNAKVATVPGDAFGAPDYIRLSFAASLENITIAAAKIAGTLGNLEKL